MHDLLSLPEQYESSYAPPFGHAMLQCFTMDPEYLNMNNGSYGTLPKPVQEACTEIAAVQERNPDLWIRITYGELLVRVRQLLADFLRVEDVDEIVMVPNASHGLNNILRSFIWGANDTIVVCTTTYGSIEKTARFLSDIPPHPSVSHFQLVFPTTREKILDDWRIHIEGLVAQNKSKGRIVAVIDAIVSNPGALLPWEDMTKICKEYNVISVIDAAHAIGQQPNLDLDAVDADFFVANCHKWLSAKRGCAVLHVPKRNQSIIKTTFPTSHTYISPSQQTAGHNFVDQFEWNGTQDFTPYMSIGAALHFRRWIGGEDAINKYCHHLAIESGKRLASLLGTSVLDSTGEFTAHMTDVRLPLSPNIKLSPQLVQMLNHKMLIERKASAAFYFHNSTWWVRLSIQIWNEISDVDKIAPILKDVCASIEQELSVAAPKL